MATQVQTICPTDGEVIVHARAIVIHDEDECYRFTCPKCKQGIDKRMTDEVRNILRGAGVPTVDELCMSFEATLDDDRNLERFILTAPNET